jgi:DNA-binding CsgD family transcriptional regulator
MDAISRELDASIMQTRYQVRQLQKKLQHQIRQQGFKPGDLEMCA